MKHRRLALILAAMLLFSACYDKSDYSPTSTLVDRVVVLSAANNATSLPADGFSRLRIEARLQGDPDFAKRTVVFSTSNGTLDGGTPVPNCNGCRMVPADGSGLATIDLVSSQQVGTAVVRAWPADAPGITASLNIGFGAAQPDQTVQFVAAPDRAPADGATISTFTVAVSPSLPAGSRQVTFQTTAGTFAPGNTASVQVNADAGGHASADLVSPRQITTARVTATVNSVTREASIRFERALPNVITAAVDMPIAPAATTTKIHVTATLLRNMGTVSDGTVVTFRATKADGTPVGLFTNVTTTTNGMASADFLPNTATPGTVTITVGAQGTGVTGTVQVVLTAS
ncbi:MAG TPA: hypothetical protein VHC97_11925 [Thermoanaerobaculia bacterium]|nr:hypothetical protein [Thermoanaerobaculia bacterium]